jgi:hypothetical protein
VATPYTVHPTGLTLHARLGGAPDGGPWPRPALPKNAVSTHRAARWWEGATGHCPGPRGQLIRRYRTHRRTSRHRTISRGRVRRGVMAGRGGMTAPDSTMLASNTVSGDLLRRRCSSPSAAWGGREEEPRPVHWEKGGLWPGQR